jgi:homotetrameric cytidine deaminase
MCYDVLVQNALKMREKSYAPYSKFTVGASLLTKDGTIYDGCNVENASYSMSMCAERTAIFKAITEGKLEFSAIAIVGGTQGEEISQYCYPCGACIQVMNEFCKPNFEIILYDGKSIRVLPLRKVLPYGFNSDTMRIDIETA